jgi:hypothetical protein
VFYFALISICAESGRWKSGERRRSGGGKGNEAIELADAVPVCALPGVCIPVHEVSLLQTSPIALDGDGRDPGLRVYCHANRNIGAG